MRTQKQIEAFERARQKRLENIKIREQIKQEEKDRKKAVAKDLFGSYNWAGSKRQEILDASIKYKQLQFDPLDEQLIAFNSKIDEFTAFMKAMTIDEDNADKLQKIMIGITKVLQTRQTLIDAIERRGERQKIAGDKGLSFLEEKKENKVII